MIVVRRRFPEAAAPVPQAGEEDDDPQGEGGRHQERREAAHQHLPREARVGLADELEERLRGVQPDGRVDGDPRRREEPDVGTPQQLAVAREAVRRPMVRTGRRVGCRHRVAVHDEGRHVDERVGQEAGWSEHLPYGPGRREASGQPGDGGGLEPRRGTTPQALVGSRGHGDEPEGGGHAGRRRGAFQDARETQQRQAADEHGDGDDDGAWEAQLGGGRREDDRDETEERSDLHDAVVPEAVRQDAEGR